MMLRWLVILICMLQIMPAVARMYQWNDPATGTTQLSGSPPAWYRSDDNGPRVFVFERGRVIDDTAVVVSEERRIALRQQAFMMTEQDSRMARTKAEQAERTLLTLERPQTPEQLSRLWQQVESELHRQHESLDPDAPYVREPAAVDRVPDLTPGQVEELRSMISAWEAEQARALRRILMPDEDAPLLLEDAPEREREIVEVPLE